jgi:hypothetical protein
MFERRASATHSGGLTLSVLLALAALVALLATASVAEGARTKHFHPVRKTAHALVFKVRGVDANQIVRAKATLRAKHRTQPQAHRLHRRLSVSRVRAVTTHRRYLRLRKSKFVRGGNLEITLHPSTPPKPGSGNDHPDPPDPPVGGSSCSFGDFSASTPPGACWRPYSDASPFNTPVTGKPDAANSASVVQRMMSFSPVPAKINTGNADTAGDWSHPIYYSTPTDPLFTIHCVENWGTCPIEGMRIRIPDPARAAGGSDGHMAVIDQADGWEYDFWQVRNKPSGGGTISISWGDRTRIGTPDATGLDTNATAAHFGLAAGMIRPAELASGNIDHALFMVVKCTSGRSVAPAGSGAGRPCSDIGLSNANAPAMGQHFYLDMSDAEIAALDKPEWQKTILRALAHYGAYVGDTGSEGWGFMFESGSSYTSFGLPDPWVTLGDRFGVPKWQNPDSGRMLRIWDMQNAVNWGARLKVAAD